METEKTTIYERETQIMRRKPNNLSEMKRWRNPILKFAYGNTSDNLSRA